MKTMKFRNTFFAVICLMAVVLSSCGSDKDDDDSVTNNSIEVIVKHTSAKVSSFSGGTIISVPKNDIVTYNKADFSLVVENDGNVMLTKSYDVLPENSSFKFTQKSKKIQVVHTVNLLDDVSSEDLTVDVVIKVNGSSVITKTFQFDPEVPNTYIITLE